MAAHAQLLLRQQNGLLQALYAQLLGCHHPQHTPSIGALLDMVHAGHTCTVSSLSGAHHLPLTCCTWWCSQYCAGIASQPHYLVSYCHSQGTSDVTPWLAVPAALSVMRALGPARITQYSHTLVTQAAQMLHTRLHDTAHACSSGAGSADGTGNTISASSTGSTGSSTGRSTGSIAGRSGAAQTGIVKSSAAVGDSNSLPTKGKTTGKGVAQAGQAGKAAARSAAGRNQKAGQEAKPRIDILGVDGQGRNAGMLAVRLPPLQVILVAAHTLTKMPDACIYLHQSVAIVSHTLAQAGWS